MKEGRIFAMFFNARAHRDAHFPVDLANARALGKRPVERALTRI